MTKPITAVSAPATMGIVLGAEDVGTGVPVGAVGDGGLPVDDGGLPVDDGELPVDDGGLTVDDGGLPVGAVGDEVQLSKSQAAPLR